MMMNEGQKAEKNKQHNTEVFLTQKELAKRWKTSQATIKRLRECNELPVFYIPKSTRVLYPVKGIQAIEKKGILSTPKKDWGEKAALTTKGKPVKSSNTSTEWRI